MKTYTAQERALETIARFEREIGETVSVSGQAFSDAVFRSFTHFAEENHYAMVQRQKDSGNLITVLTDSAGDIFATAEPAILDGFLGEKKPVCVAANDGSIVHGKYRSWMSVPILARKETLIAIMMARKSGKFHKSELKAAELLGDFFTQRLHEIRVRNKKVKALSDDVRHKILLHTQTTLGREQSSWDGHSTAIDYSACTGSDVASSCRFGEDSLLLYTADVTADDTERQTGLIYLDTWFSILSQTSLDARGMLQRLNSDMVKRKAECYASIALIRYMKRQEKMEIAGCGNIGAVFFCHETMESQVLDFGPAAGISNDTDMKMRIQPVKSGDIVCAFTDGISGTRKRNGDLFGSEAVAEIIRKNYFLSAEELAKKILSTVQDREEKDINADDRTLQILKIE